jgi:hypothetical protein
VKDLATQTELEKWARDWFHAYAPDVSVPKGIAKMEAEVLTEMLKIVGMEVEENE